MGEHKPKTTTSTPQSPALPKAGVAGSVKRLGWLRNRKRAGIAVSCIFAVCLAVGALIYIRQQAPQVANVCDANLAREASAQNELKNVTAFGRLVERIKAKPHYENDPNCLYIIAQYQMVSGDVPGAKATISRLKKDYADFRYHSTLDGGKASLSGLEKQYDFNKDLDDNSSGGIDPAI